MNAFVLKISLYYLAAVIFTSKALKDGCRTVSRRTQIQNKTFTDHIIANESVDTQEMCMLLCYTKPRCVSSNFDSNQGASPNCELSSEDDEKYPQKLIDAPGVIYQAFENECNKQPCPLRNMTCLTGYGSHGYQCVCPKCFTGRSCELVNTVLSFSKQSVESKIVLENPFERLTEITIAMWIQANPTQVSEITPFGYATRNDDNEMKIAISKGKIEIALRGGNCDDFNYNVQYDQWHHIALTWETALGKGRLYIDGKKTGSCTRRPGTYIERGALVIGQDQDSYKGGFQQYQSYQGNMTSFNIWNKELPADEIAKLATSRPSAEGNAVKWKDLIPLRSSRVNDFCP